MISLSEEESIDADNTLPGMPDRTGNDARRGNRVSRLEFQTMDWPGTDSLEDMSQRSASSALGGDIQDQITALMRQLELQEQQAAIQIDLAREEARTASRQEWEVMLEEQIAMERSRVARTCEEFGKERARYFTGVETEVVKLALAIAKRVLHREVNLDPLLLLGAVRVVLEKVADNSTMELHVPAAEVEGWRSAIVAAAESRLQLVGDERLGAGECILETSVGKVELGVSAQLEEIEKGFFDLLQQRPA